MTLLLLNIVLFAAVYLAMGFALMVTVASSFHAKELEGSIVVLWLPMFFAILLVCVVLLGLRLSGKGYRMMAPTRNSP